MTASKGKGWLWAWALVFPVPTIVLTCVSAAFVGTSFHSPQVGGIVGIGLFAAVAAKARRDGPRFLAAFLTGVGCTLAAAFGLFVYALMHMGPIG